LLFCKRKLAANYLLKKKKALLKCWMLESLLESKVLLLEEISHTKKKTHKGKAL